MTTADTLDGVLGTAPELQSAPDLAVASANSPDPNGTAQALAHTANSYAIDQTVQGVSKMVGHPNALHQTLGWLHKWVWQVGVTQPIKEAEQLGGSALSGAAHLANSGLQEVQHQYRTLHDVEARHGPVAGFLAALGLTAAGVAAVALAPEEAAAAVGVGAGTLAIAGAEAAAGVASRTIFSDSWHRTEHGAQYRGTYDRQTGQYSGGPVSMGRDLAHHLPHSMRFISGITDGLADLTLDPAALAGGAVAEARNTRLAVNTVDGLDRALTSPLTSGSVNRAFDQIAGEASATKIALQYPKFAPIAEDLSKLTTRDDVIDYFRNNLGSAEFLARTPGTLPNLPLTRVPFRAIRTAAAESSSPVLRAFTLLPTDFDPELLRYSNKGFDPAGQGARLGVYRALRFGQSDTVARQVTDAMFATDDLGLRRNIWVNGMHSALVDGLGLSDDNRFVRHIMQTLEDTTPDIGGAENVYAASADGRNLSILPALDNQPARAAAVFENQTGRWAFPDFAEVLRAKRAESNIRNVVGAADDAFYQHFTQPIFKRAALLTGGFALRIAAAEAIPAAFREGFLNLVKSSIELHLGGNAYQKALSDEEVGHVASAVQSLIGGVTRSSSAKTAEDVDLATRAVLANDGHLVAPALSAGGGAPNYLDGEVERKTGMLAKILHQVPPEKRYGNDFGIWGQGPDHIVPWQAATKEAANSELGQAAASALHSTLTAGGTMTDATRNAMDAVQSVLDGKSEQWLGKFERHFTSTSDLTPHEDWAKVVVDSVKGVSGHPYDPNTLHMDVLDAIARGEAPPRGVLDAVPAAERPMVKGRIEAPTIPEGPTAVLANAGYRKLDSIINFLSREPMYFNELKSQYEPFKALVDEGLLSKDEALRIAQVRAVNEVTPFIHNPLERSQFSTVVRNLMPFYFAQTQSYRRVGRLLLDDPGAFRRYQLATSALHDVGHTVDDNGQKTFVMPGAGFLGQQAAGALGMLGFKVTGSVPVAFSGNMQSLNTVLPFAEDSGGIGIGPVTARFGPAVAIPMHALETMFPEVGIPLANKVLGPVGASGGFIDQLVPNTPLRNLLKAQGIVGGGRDLQNAMVQTIQALDYRQQQALRRWEANGEQGPRPQIVPDAGATADVKQQFVDRVRNQSRILLYTKAIISAVSPVSPKLDVGDLGLQNELRDLMKSKGPDGQPLGLGGAVAEFLAKHPDATAYTVFGSKNLSGADLPANHPAQDFLHAHMDVLHKYPAAGAWLIPQSADPYSQAVYNEQLAMGLRVKKAPDEVVNDVYIAQGNDQFFNRDLPAHQQALAAAQGDAEATKTENTNWSAYVKNVLGAQNPVWYDNFTSSTRQNDRDRAITQLVSMFQNGDAPPGPQTSDVKGLLDDYRTYQTTVVAGRSDSWSADEREAAKQNWLAYLDGLAREKPNLSPIIDKLFRSV